MVQWKGWKGKYCWCFCDVFWSRKYKRLTYFLSCTCRMCTHVGRVVCCSLCCVFKCYVEDVRWRISRFWSALSVWCVRSIRLQICAVSLWPELNFMLTVSVCFQFCHSCVCACVSLCAHASIYNTTIIQPVSSSCVKSVNSEFLHLLSQGMSLKREDLGNGSFYLVYLWCSGSLTGNQREGAPHSSLYHSVFDTTRADRRKRQT